MKYLTALFVLFALSFSMTSQSSCFSLLEEALSTPGFYAGFYGGINGGYELTCQRVKTNRGYYVGLKVGKSFFSCLRLEEDFTWQSNEVNQIRGGGNIGTATTVQFDHIRGTIDIWSLMTNGIFDIPFNCHLPARPYIGAGIGYACANGHWSGNIIKQQPLDTTVVPPVQPPPKVKHFRSHLHRGGFAWQILAGLNFSLCYDIVVSLEYRFFKQDCRINNHKFGIVTSKSF